MNRARRYRKFVIFALPFVLVLFVAKVYYDTNAIEVKHYQIKQLPLGEALAGLKVAFLTDLHIRKIDVRENKILEILHEEKPDLILLAGDYISFKGPYELVMSFFRQLKAPYGVYGVLGNTEYSNENGSCILCHHQGSKGLKEKQNPTFLRNATSVFEVNHKKINILGVDDPVNEKSDLRTTLKKVNPRGPSILLAHSPEIFEEASGYGIDLILCGHNHGGQIFITKILRKILPFDPVLDYLGGFFQKEETLMYVSRGVGTSYLPFRLGVKPEITFFEFTNNTNKETNDTNKRTNSTNKEIRMARMNPTNSTAALQHSSTAPLSVAAPQHGSTSTQQHLWSLPLIRVNAVISNHPPRTAFAGLSFSNIIETFNILRVFDSLGVTSTPHHPSTASPQHGSTAAQHVLFDFESNSDLDRLNWECHKWFELSGENATSGNRSLKVSLPSGQYPGINFEKMEKNWSEGKHFEMDVFNPSEERITFHIRIDDNKSGWAYADRFDINFELNQGMNHISIPADSIRTNIHRRPLNLSRIKRLMVFIPNNSKPRELYIDNIRLK